MTENTTPESWKLTLPCRKTEAEQLQEDVAAFAGRDFPPVLMTSEPDPHKPEDWLLEAFFAEEPTEADIETLLGLLPSSRREDVVIEPVYPADWVAISQSHLQPITAGRFHIYAEHTRDSLKPGFIGIQIEAGQAFGTGQHATTSGCLATLDSLATDGFTPKNALDLGTGSGILAFAMAKCWPTVRVTASDIDPVSVDVAIENAAMNGVPVGEAAGQIAFLPAAGLDHPTLRANAPYDLVTANILAGPLIDLAPDIAGSMAAGGWLILAGLLTNQEEAVLNAYNAQGLELKQRRLNGDWPTLLLQKPS
ncbi:50S ribosomal protein L11 methyltransferase [Pedomonas sp. V897]|uniref:50S ribosomal protein L11 methyltransferase n=1 Tax=Pedomonas sp. V897 TaxID=3446482 RepID=UPI003EE10E10